MNESTELYKEVFENTPNNEFSIKDMMMRVMPATPIKEIKLQKQETTFGELEIGEKFMHPEDPSPNTVLVKIKKDKYKVVSSDDKSVIVNHAYEEKAEEPVLRVD